MEAVASAAPCTRPPTSSKKRRLALAPLQPLQQPQQLQRAPAAAGAAAGAAPDDGVIDLTGDDEAVQAAFRDWELIDLTGAAEYEPSSPGVVDELKEQRAKIQAFLSARGTGLKVQRCDANPHAAPGAPLYERFIAARRRCRDQRVQLVFHGTPSANVEAICRNGLDPKRRAGQAMGPGGAPCLAHRATRLGVLALALQPHLFWGPHVFACLARVSRCMTRCRILCQRRHHQHGLLPWRQADAGLCSAVRQERHHRRRRRRRRRAPPRASAGACARGVSRCA